MDKWSFFIEEKALSGAYPSQTEVNALEDMGVVCFVDLTYPGEKKIRKYNTTKKYINYPIKDHKVPTNWQTFAKLIITISKIISKLTGNEKIFISCKGGHGRSGVMVACILCYHYRITPERSLYLTNMYHNNRRVMKDKWRRIGSPQTHLQKNFVSKFFSPYVFYAYGPNSKISYLSNYSQHTIVTPRGQFSTAEAALHAYKSDDIDYIQKQRYSTSPSASRYLAKTCKQTDRWLSIRTQCMYDILNDKLERHSEIKKLLINTGLRPITFYSSQDTFWGNGGDGSGSNVLGTLWEKIRSNQYLLMKSRSNSPARKNEIIIGSIF